MKHGQPCAVQGPRGMLPQRVPSEVGPRTVLVDHGLEQTRAADLQWGEKGGTATVDHDPNLKL